jgi:hypothetical protein
MTTIRTTVHDRRIEVPAPDDLPDGTDVVVDVVSASEKLGLDESAWDDSPEGIAQWLAWLDTLQPLILSDQELAEIEADRQARQQWEKQQFVDHADQLARQWE